MKTDKYTSQEPAQYKASITREQFMFYEMRTTAKLLIGNAAGGWTAFVEMTKS